MTYLHVLLYLNYSSISYFLDVGYFLHKCRTSWLGTCSSTDNWSSSLAYWLIHLLWVTALLLSTDPDVGVGTKPENPEPEPVPNRPEAGRDGIDFQILLFRPVPSRPETNGTGSGLCFSNPDRPGPSRKKFVIFFWAKQPTSEANFSQLNRWMKL